MRKNLPKGPNFSVNVTAEVMELSRDRDSSHCMVAMAVKDAMPKATSISVDLQTIRFSLPDKRLRYTYLTPRVAQLAIIQFDQGKMPEPFSFKLAGAHVTTMYTKRRRGIPHGTLTPAQQAALAKAQRFAPSHVPDHPELTKTRLATRDRTSVPDRIGGHLLPRTPLARRRAFGLRALRP